MKKRISQKFYILYFLLFPTFFLHCNDILQDVVRKVFETEKSAKLPVVVFDLDGTLFHTGMRSKKIFIEFAETKGDTALWKKLEVIDERKMKYRVRESLIEAGICDSSLQKGMIDSWRKKFFSSEYLKYDEPLDGASEFVNKLYDSGALIIYLTGRDVTQMLSGTVGSLQKNGFPIGVERTELIMKPERYMKTTTYKKKVLKYIERLGAVIAAFENEPANINLLHEMFPDAISVFLETSHKPNAPPVKKEIHRIKNYITKILPLWKLDEKIFACNLNIFS